MPRPFALWSLVLLAACGVPEESVGDEPLSGVARLEPLEPQGFATVGEVGGNALVFSGRGMGVAVRLWVVGGEWAELSQSQRAAFSELRRLEGVVNLWDPGSELTRWNAGPPAGGRVSPELAELVGMALELCGETGGAFDPTVGALLASRGHYGEPIPLSGDPGELVGCDRVRLVETEEGAVLERLHPGVRLDLSGLAKGWAADRLKAQLVGAGVTNACLDLGSSTIVAWGPGPDGRGWRYEHPFKGGSVGLEPYWWLVDQAASTSSRTPQSVDPADLTGVHLVDPREARFVEQQQRIVMVRGTDAAACDAWATAAAATGAKPEESSGVTAVIRDYLGQDAEGFPVFGDPFEPQTTR